MTQPDKPWFRKRGRERGGGYDITGWQGAAVLCVFILIVCIPPIATLLASQSLLLTFVIATACAVGGAWWLVRMIRAHGVPDA